MAEVLITCIGIVSGAAITIAYFEGKPREQIEFWGIRGTAVGFLAGLFLAICCPEASQLLCRQ